MPAKKGEETSKTTIKTGTVKNTTVKTAANKKTSAPAKPAAKKTTAITPAKAAVKTAKPSATKTTPKPAATKTTSKTSTAKAKTSTVKPAVKKPSAPKKAAEKETVKKAPAAKSAVKKPAAKASTPRTTVKTAAAKTTVKAPVKKATIKQEPVQARPRKTAASKTTVKKAEVKQTAEKTIPKTTVTDKTASNNVSSPKTEAKKYSVFDKITGKNIPAPDFTPAEEPQSKTPPAKGSPASLLNAALKAEGFYASGNDLALSVNGKIFTFTWRTGTIIGTRHDRKTEISGGGGSISGHTQNGYGTISGNIDPITTRNTEIIEFFLKDPATGVERPYTIYNNDVPIRDGQTMTIASVHHNNKSSIISFCNASSRRWNLALNTIDIAENLGLGKSLHMKDSYRRSLLFLFALVLPGIASSIIMMFMQSWSSIYGIMGVGVVIGLLLYFAKKAQLKAKYAWLEPFRKKLGVLSGYLC